MQVRLLGGPLALVACTFISCSEQPSQPVPQGRATKSGLGVPTDLEGRGLPSQMDKLLEPSRLATLLEKFTRTGQALTPDYADVTSDKLRANNAEYCNMPPERAQYYAGRALSMVAIDQDNFDYEEFLKECRTKVFGKRTADGNDEYLLFYRQEAGPLRESEMVRVENRGVVATLRAYVLRTTSAEFTGTILRHPALRTSEARDG